MTNTDELCKLIDNSGFKMKFIAEKVGLTYQGLKNKVEGKTEFTTSEVKSLCELLRISSLKEKERIFFAG